MAPAKMKVTKRVGAAGGAAGTGGGSASSNAASSANASALGTTSVGNSGTVTCGTTTGATGGSAGIPTTVTSPVGNSSVRVVNSTAAGGGIGISGAPGTLRGLMEKRPRRPHHPWNCFPWFSLSRKATWGMVLLLVASLSHMTTGGLSLASVILVRHLQPTFNGTTTFQAAWVVSLSWGFGWLLSPIIAAMCTKYGARSVCVLGGFVAALGALFNSFAEHLVHVFLSYSMILSFGAAMCHVSSESLIGSHFARHSGRRYKIYEGSKYIGMAVFVYAMDAAISEYGWLHGLQMTTLVVGINFLFGLLYAVIVRRIERSPQKDDTDKTVMFLSLLNSAVLRDRLLFLYFGVEVLLHIAMRAPLILLVINNDEAGKPNMDVIYLLLVTALAAFMGSFAWDIPRKCVPTSTLFFVQEQMLLYVVITACITMATELKSMLVIFGFFGLNFGGLSAFMTSQVRHLIIKEHRQQAESWSMCARGVGMIVGTPFIVWINELDTDFCIGYIVCAGTVMLCVCTLYVIMRRLRVREIDIALIEQSSNMAFRSHGNHISERPCQKHCGNGTLVDGGEDPEFEIHEIVDPDILWRAGVISNLDPGCGMHLVGDYYDGEQEVTPELARRKTLAEPSLPILPEVPSQENSSVSRLDCSIHSGGRRESELDALVVGMGSDDGGSSNACFSTLDEAAAGGTSAKLSPAPSTSTLMAQTQAWVRKSSLPEKSPTLPKIRRFSVDPDIMRNAMYIAIPRSSVGSVETVESSSHSGSTHGYRDGLLPNGPTAGSTPTTTTPSPVILTSHSSPTSKVSYSMNSYPYYTSGAVSPNLVTTHSIVPPTVDGNPTLVLSPSSPISIPQSAPVLTHISHESGTHTPSMRTVHSNSSFLVAVSSLDSPLLTDPVQVKDTVVKTLVDAGTDCGPRPGIATPEDSTIDLDDSPTITETSV